MKSLRDFLVQLRPPVIIELFARRVWGLNMTGPIMCRPLDELFYQSDIVGVDFDADTEKAGEFDEEMFFL